MLPGRPQAKLARALRRHHLRRKKTRWRERLAGWCEPPRRDPASREPGRGREDVRDDDRRYARTVGVRATHPRHFCRMCSLRTLVAELSWRDEALLELAAESGDRVLRDLGRRAPAQVPRRDGRPTLGAPWSPRVRRGFYGG